MLRDLEIFHVISFSSSSSKNAKFGFEDRLTHPLKKHEPNDYHSDLEKHVIQSQFDDESQDETLNKGDLGTRVRDLRRAFEALKLPQKLAQAVEGAELRLSEINEKLKRVLNFTKTTPLPEKTRWAEKGSEPRRPGFTSQFSSCRSIERSRSPEVAPPQTSESKRGERPSRVLFSNPSKRTSRFLLREFINKNVPAQSEEMHSPFEKKTPTTRQVVGESGHDKELVRKSTNGSRALEVENLRLNNQLDNEIERRKMAEQELEEGKEGLETLLESMPRKVKQSPLLKIRNKHFREVLELVKFQVEEYKDVIKEFKERSRGEFSIEDSEEEKTEDLVGTSVMNSGREHSLDVEDPRHRWKWSNHASGARRPDTEVSIQGGDKSSLDPSRHVSKQSSNQFDWGDHAEEGSEESHEEHRKTLNIEIPESETLKTGEFSQEEGRVTLEEMKRKQCMVQGPNSRRSDSKENLYCSSGVRRGEMVLEKIGKKGQKMLEMVRSAEDKDVLQDMLGEVEREVALFIQHLRRADFESVGMNLYKQTSQKYSEGLQERLMEIEEKYHNLEREMAGLRMENEKMRKSQRGGPTTADFDCAETEEEAETTPSEVTAQRGPVEEGQDAAERDVQAEAGGEDNAGAEQDMDMEITEEINEMIFDLLEVIEDKNISTVEKMKVIRIFLHHTHDLLGNHEQMYLVEQSNEFRTGEGSMRHKPASQGGNSAEEAENETGSGEKDEETNLECWGEKLEALPDTEEDYLSREVYVVEEKQLTEIKEDDGSEDYDSHDPRSQLANQLDHPPPKDFRDERGYSSLEVLHDRAGETEIRNQATYDRSNYERANAIEELRREGESRQTNKLEESLQDQINELEDEKVGLKNKNIMLNDKISYLNQKLVLLETQLEEMEKCYLTAKDNKREIRSRYEAKSKRLKEANQQVAELTKARQRLEEEVERLNLEAEKKAEQVQEILEKVESLQELNDRLATENDLKSQELLEYSLIRSSINTGATPFKNDSERHGKPETDRQIRRGNPSKTRVNCSRASRRARVRTTS